MQEFELYCFLKKHNQKAAQVMLGLCWDFVFTVGSLGALRSKVDN